MDITIHQTDHTIADFSQTMTYLTNHITRESSGIHIFPELFLCGYPLQDLCLQQSFIATYLLFLEEVSEWFKTLGHPSITLLMGGLKYELSSQQIPKRIENVVYQLDSQQPLLAVYTKRLLPNYDIFDEKKYFFAGQSSVVLELQNKKFGLLICEDMWPSSIHQSDPVEDLQNYVKEQQLKLDGVINFSASPFYRGKHQKRRERASHISHLLQCPFYYVNKVGGEDEVLFDGQSFALNGDQVFLQAKRFEADVLKISAIANVQYKKFSSKNETLTWEELFSPNLDLKTSPAALKKMSDLECQETLEALCFGVQDYARKNGFQKFTIALSGGIDSSLVLTIMRLSLKQGQYLEALYMPSIHSSSLSHELSLKLCQNLGISLKSLPIKFMHSAGKNLFQQTFPGPFEGITDENIQARIRAMLLYTRSNQINSMIINTSNKSELAVGYSTQYGDSVGAISLLGDLYKSEVFQLANYINAKFDQLIPEEIIKRPPSAELRADQQDDQTLPPYRHLDSILEALLSYRHAKRDLLKMGFEAEHINTALNLYRKSEYKRHQFCPILKINSKSFGFGYRIPVSKNSGFYIK